MSTTTDPSNNAAAEAVVAEQVAVENILNANTSIEEATAMELDHEVNVPIQGVAETTFNSTELPAALAPASIPVQAPTPILMTTNASTPTAATTLTPTRIGTPSIIPNGNGSRAASVQAESTYAIPTIAREHGAPARQYLNEKVTPHLLEIMKKIGVEQPENPIRALAEFLDQRATELGQ